MTVASHAHVISRGTLHAGAETLRPREMLPPPTHDGQLVPDGNKPQPHRLAIDCTMAGSNAVKP